MVANVLNINMTSVKYETTQRSGRLSKGDEYTPPVINITKENGRFDITNTNVKLEIDTKAMRNSMTIGNAEDWIRGGAQRGKDAIAGKTADIVDMGNRIMHIEQGANIADYITNKMVSNAMPETIIAFIPSERPQINYVPGNVTINYTPVRQNFSFTSEIKRFTYTPAEFSLRVTQHPSVEYQYVGPK